MVKNFNKRYGRKKRLDKFWDAIETKEYVAAPEEEMGSIKSDSPSCVMPEHGSPNLGEPTVSGLKQVINSFDDRNGTYIHPELGILLTRYLSPKFAIACDRFIKSKMKDSSNTAVIPKDFPDALLIMWHNTLRF